MSKSDLKQHEPRQIAWQNWRNELYQHLCDERRRTANNAEYSQRRALASSMYTESEGHKATSEALLLDSLEAFYNQVVNADSVIKAAHHAQNLEQYVAALEHAEVLMEQH